MPWTIAPTSLFEGMPNVRTVIERSMKSKYLSEVRFSRVKGASYCPTCRMAMSPQGARATKLSVACGVPAKSPAMLKYTIGPTQPATSARARRTSKLGKGSGGAAFLPA
jgi:hypothetical protein